MFQLARELHMTVGEMGERMSSAEFSAQMAYDSVLAGERAKAERLAKQRATRGGRG